MRSRRVAPDNAWYKWKGDEFIGYDWRRAETNPLVRENYERHERRKARDREYEKRCRREGRLRASKQYRSAHGGGGSLQFRGWRWRCPVCEGTAKTLYLPMAFENVLGGLMGETIERAVATNVPTPPALRLGGRFACKDCYRVRNFCRGNHNFWNGVIGYLTGGLVYGYEVRGRRG